MNRSKPSITDPSLNLVLASTSPRRRELLTKAGYEFTVLHGKVSEIFDESLNPTEVPSYLAELKVEGALTQVKELNTPGYLVLGADTIVTIDGLVLGKPRDFLQACDFLRRLNGRTHHVITGIALRKSSTNEAWIGSASTAVTFRDLSREEITRYVETGEPMDKAGAYGMQGEGRHLVAHFDGSWSNIVGLPLETLAGALRDRGWITKKRPGANDPTGGEPLPTRGPG